MAAAIRRRTRAIVFVDEVPYLIVDREPCGFRAVELTRREAMRVRTALDDTHADLEAAFVGARRRLGTPTRR